MNIKSKLPLIGTLCLCLTLFACEKIDRTEFPQAPPDVGQSLIDYSWVQGGIPKDYGRFVNATLNDRNLATLWFERADGSIVGIRVDLLGGYVAAEPIIIERS